MTIYQGNQRIKDISKLKLYDAVITTYGTISSEYKNFIKKILWNIFISQSIDFQEQKDETNLKKFNKREEYLPNKLDFIVLKNIFQFYPLFFFSFVKNMRF